MDIRLFLRVCPYCAGSGSTEEHDPQDPHIDGECSGCPIQAPCEPCETTGLVWIPGMESLLTGTEPEEYDNGDLPF